MDIKGVTPVRLGALRLGLCSIAVAQLAMGAPLATVAASQATRSPIKHVIVIIGENRSFDHVFATYTPKKGESVDNLLSKGIVSLDAKKNAGPGPNFGKAQQLAATDDSSADTFLLSPPKQEFFRNQLPTPLAGGPKASNGYFSTGNTCATGTPLLACAQETENGLDAGYYTSLIAGGTGLTSRTPDTRINNVSGLPAGPFQLTNDATFKYADYAASPVHRFYQMWQQLDCKAEEATSQNPSGCNAKLFSWVEVTVGAGTNGATRPPTCYNVGDAPPCFTANFIPSVPAAQTTGEGSTALGFYNMQRGDAPYFKELADHYAMSDNFHQSVNGGTGANHIMFGHGDAIWYSDGNGKALVPPQKKAVFTAPFLGEPNPDQGVVSEIENPNPAPGTNNWYIEDGYGAGGFGSPVSGGGSYSECWNLGQPGVSEIVNYLQKLPHPINANCEKGHYYLLNNYNPGYFGDGSNASTDQNAANTPFTIPPSSVRSIGDVLLEHKVSWKYYGDQWNNYLKDKYQENYGTNGPNADEYCNICNPFQYDTSIMSHPDLVAEHIQDTLNLYSDIAGGTLPAVSIVKPSGYVDGHPASSKLDLFEGFVKKIVEEVKDSPYAKDTAIFITFDEGGGYYDSGYVQPVDFFGDGTRIPLIVVSPYTKAGHISHEYTDHVSILKFIERNWSLEPVSHRSRDNFPNPIVKSGNPYVPVNSPAIGDLFDLFDF